jgi:Leucine-rich repeat (LRR) protein
MNKKNDFALVRKPASAVEKVAPGAKRILSGMVTDTLALTRFRLGEYEWCEPDYRQILLWADETKKSPTEIIKRLIECKSTIQDGRFIEIHWPDGSMWVKKISFVPCLKIKVFHVEGGSYLVANLNMQKNPANKLSDFQVSKINLAGLQDLEVLAVSMQLLEELDLNPTSNLKYLRCESNSLSRINFAGCQNLAEIYLRNNFLSEIDLSNLPALKSLECNQNRLSSLDLFGAPALEYLDCRENRWGVGDYDRMNSWELYPMEILDITPLKNLRVLKYDAGETRLIQRSDQNF